MKAKKGNVSNGIVTVFLKVPYCTEQLFVSFPTISTDAKEIYKEVYKTVMDKTTLLNLYNDEL